LHGGGELMIVIGNRAYELVKDNKNGWNLEAFRERYSEVLDRYDYIVGDWGYSQLRLKGFFREGSPRAGKESSISFLQDYINEYCNFGCAYFIIEKVSNKGNSNNNNNNNNNHNHNAQPNHPLKGKPE
jgi:uncharacterized protein YutD